MAVTDADPQQFPITRAGIQLTPFPGSFGRRRNRRGLYFLR